MDHNLIGSLSNLLEKAVTAQLIEQERVLIKLQGAFQEALVCTGSRIFIVKRGFMAGNLFGRDVFQIPLANVAGAQVNRHLLTGYFEISAGGMQNTAKSYWQSGRASPEKAPNCVALSRSQFSQFEAAANFIMQQVHATQIGAPAPLSDDPVILLQKLDQLRKSGLISDAEFASKRAEIIARI
jgi:hypothetical protein